MKSLSCTSLSCTGLFAKPRSPQWIDDYINSVAGTPHIFDLIEFENAWAQHIRGNVYVVKVNGKTLGQTCSCTHIPSQVIRTFWGALTSVVHRTIEQVRSGVELVRLGLVTTADANTYRQIRP